MSTKHFFPSTEGTTALGLDSLVARNKNLALDTPNKVVYSRTHTPDKVTVISGGGGGHEPAWSGYVGDGMLAAAVNGDVFASPATKQIMAAIKHVPSDAGIILCITNYTGDNLHFGLAREKASGLGHKVAILRMTDDVALGREQTKNTGRRGLAANMFVLKLCGSASQQGYDFESCYKIGQSVNDNAVTVGSSLDHCHIPGRAHHRSVPEDTYVLGMGIHNEPGLHEKSPIPPIEEIVTDMLKYCLDPNDPDRAFVEFRKDDVVTLLINNFGGMSQFEIEALTTVTRQLLKRDWNIEPTRIYAQCFETSLNAPGWSLSLVNFSGIERQTQTPVPKLLSLLDLDTQAPAWPRNGYADFQLRKDSGNELRDGGEEETAQASPAVNASLIEAGLRNACRAGIGAEPDLTTWDIQMGDGDCGEAVENMCKNILKTLDAGVCKEGKLFHILDEVEHAVEDVGGTLAAIISIVLASFTSQLKLAYAKDPQSFQMGIESSSKAAGQALKNLMGYTSARQGGRTVMDSLIPFCESIERDVDLNKACEAAQGGADSTRGMKAKFGRATYVGDKGTQSKQTAPPDPGAMAATIFLKGLRDGLRNASS
ncbi:hypothetical protein D0862_10978 [Hortaea werneckii]|uniref:Dihydroxyacetone kinase n=1 Tax=Hortaea werneckii TaxID=91943 RepID=A0A3M7FBJ3_HORWE|nr:hypothetical protein D0862_10978 [Hortaea werneckii]